MPGPGITTRSIEQSTSLTHLPPSFDGNPVLYASALTSVMAIACLGLAVAGWMARDTWRDRFHSSPTSLLFAFRVMMWFAGFAAFTRSMPEVLYLQTYGDSGVSTHVQSLVLTGKRIADSLGLWFVMTWQIILVAIYPPLCVALSTGPARYVVVDAYSTWPRLRRPAICFVCIVLVAVAFAYGKVYGR